MKKLLITTCSLLTIATLLLPQVTVAQKAKPAKAKAETISQAPAKPEELPLAERVTSTIKPAKAATSMVKATPATGSKPAATTVSTTKLAPAKAKEIQSEKAENTESHKNVRVMTHEEIEKMMAEKALMMEGIRDKPAPDFTATDLNGKTYNLTDLKGKTVVLNFWFIGCKPCVMEMPHLNKLVEKFKGEDVVFIAFALDSDTALQKFLAKNPFDYNIIPDAGKITQSTYNVSSYPTSIVINKEGIVQDYIIGYSEDVDDKLVTFIEKSLQTK